MSQIDANWERIGREVGEIREDGYRCTLQQDGANAYITVQVDRESSGGPQPVMIYLQLDDTFPTSRPQMVVTILAPASPESNELGEWELEIDSSTRLAWKPDRSRLLEVIMDIERGVHTEHLALANPARHVEQPEHTLPTDATLTTSPADMVAETAPTGDDTTTRRTFWWLTPTMILTLLLLIAVGSLIYALFFRDPCAADWQKAHGDLSSNDTATVHQAVQLLESLYRRGQAGERGSCQLATTSVLNSAYFRAGDAALKAGDAAQAQQDYNSARIHEGAPDLVKQGLQKALTLSLKPIWQEANTLIQANPPIQWTTVITDLQHIQKNDQNAINPADNSTITDTLDAAYVSWGDELYKQNNPDQALESYKSALKLDEANSRAAEGQEWASISISMRDPQADWSHILDLLTQRAEKTPDARDPAGRPIDALLYTVHVRYGQALLKRNGDVGKQALDQAELALGLLSAADDAGNAARDLQAHAQLFLSQSGQLELQMRQITDKKDWLTQLATYKVPSKNGLGKLVNLIVITRDTEIRLTLTLPDANGNRPLALKGDVAYEAVDGGNAILKYTKGTDSRDIALDFSENATYVVLVAPLSKP